MKREPHGSLLWARRRRPSRSLPRGPARQDRISRRYARPGRCWRRLRSAAAGRGHVARHDQAAGQGDACDQHGGAQRARGAASHPGPSRRARLPA
jgi:hypothetical protein